MKLDFDDVMDAIADERHIDAKQVRANVLQRKVWIAEWHLPGCISESFVVCTTKENAIACACGMAKDENLTAPRGMRSNLRKYGRFDSHSPMFGTCINTVEKRTIGEFLS